MTEKVGGDAPHGVAMEIEKVDRTFLVGAGPLPSLFPIDLGK